MTLRHPTNPALWADGTPRSQGNAFDTTYVPRDPNWRRQQFDENARRSASKIIARRTAAGETSINTIKPCLGGALQKHANQRAVSAKRVEERRAKGLSSGTIHGLSKKADRRQEEQS